MSLSPSLCLFNKICSLHVGAFRVSEWLWNDVPFGIKGQTGRAIMRVCKESAFQVHSVSGARP